jgi:hypothetical protein
MERGLKSAEAYRATALLCRQQAACDPDNSWRLLGEAERWEYLAEKILASRQKNSAADGPRSAVDRATSDVSPLQPETIDDLGSHALRQKPPRYG